MAHREAGIWFDGIGSPSDFSRSHHEHSEGPTTSKALPLNTLSVVAATFPPFLCRSHVISLRFNCGNICDNWSTCAGFTTKPRDCPGGSRVLLPEGFENS